MTEVEQTRQDKTKYLKRYREIQEQIEMITAKMTRTTSAYGGIRVGGTKSPDKLTDSAQKKIELEAELKRIEESIDALPKSEYRRMLRLRYMYGLKNKEVATTTGYSVPHVSELMREAINEYESP